MEMRTLSPLHGNQKKSNPLFDKIEWEDEIKSG